MSDAPASSARSLRAPILTAGWLLAITVLGFLLRVYRLEEQSLWWDDYNGLAHLTLEGFWASMLEARRMNPESAPLFFVTQYIAAQFIGIGEYAQRMLNVVVGTLTILVVFVLGRNSFGTRAGLVAALLFAMSPPHIYHAQSLRTYPLAMLLAAVSLLAMERMLTQRPSRWLYLNAIANGAACMTHLFGLFGVLAQGTAALLVLGLRQRNLLVRWGVVQFVCLLPAALVVLSMRRRTGGDFWHFSFPTVESIIKDLIGDDLTDFAITRTVSRADFMGVPLENATLASSMAYGMLGLFLVVTAWAAVRLVLAFRKRATNGSGATPEHSLTRYTLFICYWALPVLFLVALALVWQPVVYPRYTLYACLGLYMLTGAFAQSIPWRLAVVPLVAFVFVLYAYQVQLVHTTHTRTQWRQVAEDIAFRAGPDDIIMVGAFGPPEVSHRTFSYHFPADLDIPVTKAYSTLDVLEQMRCFYLEHAESDPKPMAWYVHNPHYHQADVVKPRRYLEANGIEFDYTAYTAEEGIRLYRARAWSGVSADAPIQRPETAALGAYAAYDHVGDMQALGFEGTEADLHYLFERAFEDGIIFGDESGIMQSYVSTFIDFGAFEAAHTLLDHYERRTGDSVDVLRWRTHLEEGELESALAILLESPGLPYTPPLLVVTLWAAGEHEAARAGYGAHKDILDLPGIPIRPLMEALILGIGDFHEEAFRFRSALYPHSNLVQENMFYRLGGLESWVSACAPPWEPRPVPPETLAAAKELLASLSQP